MYVSPSINITDLTELCSAHHSGQSLSESINLEFTEQCLCQKLKYWL